MPVDYSLLEPGHQISSHSYILYEDTISRYVEAVGGQHPMRSEENGKAFVPPMAVAAMWLRGVVKDLAIPGGTLHIGQELEFKRAVTTGETVKCLATVVQNTVRRGMRFMVVKLEIDGVDGRRVMEGRGTLTLPES